MTIKSIESSSNEDYSSDEDPRDEVNKLSFNILEVLLLINISIQIRLANKK